MRKYFFCLGAYLTENQGVLHSLTHEPDVSHWHQMYSLLNNVWHNALTKMWTKAVIRLVRRCQYYENHKSSVRIAVLLSRFEPWNSGNTKHNADHSNSTWRLIKNGD